jgi:hypothetical protein
VEARVQRVLIWCGPAMIVLWLVSWLLIARFLPPHDPAATAERTVAYYAARPEAIKIGMVISMAASALLVPWAVAISGQIKRINGARALADVQMASCALLSLEFITPLGVFMAVSFRYEARPPEVTQALNDLGWILFVAVIWSVWVQVIAIGAAILIDERPEPVLPRWLGYLNLWCAVLFVPAGLVLFFRSGPFAWNGLVGIYIPLCALVGWVMAATITVHRALNRQIAEGSEPGTTLLAEPVAAS